MSENDSPVIETQDSLQESMVGRAKKIADRLDALVATPEAQMDEGIKNDIEVTKGMLASLMARYGIDAAMLASRSGEQEGLIDVTVMADRPFAAHMGRLIYYIADGIGVKHVYIQNWNDESGPKRKGGVPAGGWDFGYRLFGYRSDIERLKMMYAIARNAALAGVTRVKGVQQFGQDQRRMREDWLDGFNGGIFSQIRKAEQEARDRAEAEQRDRAERLMAAGEYKSEEGVALVLASRSEALNLAWDLANGITPEIKARRAARSKELTAQYAAEREAAQAEKAACTNCQRSKSGYCRKHPRPSYGRSRSYGSQYAGTEYANGFQAGQSTHLGSQGGVSDTTGRGGIGR